MQMKNHTARNHVKGASSIAAFLALLSVPGEFWRTVGQLLPWAALAEVLSPSGKATETLLPLVMCMGLRINGE